MKLTPWQVVNGRHWHCCCYCCCCCCCCCSYEHVNSELDEITGRKEVGGIKELEPLNVIAAGFEHQELWNA